jgi:hypothetical protein
MYVEMDENDSDGASPMRITLTNCLIAANADHGMHLNGNVDARSSRVDVRLVNCTVADNGKDGLFAVSSESWGNSAAAFNTIFAGNGGRGIAMVDLSLGGPTITEEYNDYYGNTASNIVRVGTGGTNYPALHGTTLTVDPRFRGGKEPWNLTRGGACVDSASPAYAPEVDILGTPRPVDAGDDRGAYEFVPDRGTVIILF